MKNAKAISAFHALAQESRLDVFRLLIENKDEGLAAGQISEILDIPPTTMSFHLSQLRNSGLVNSEKRGRSVIYSINFKKVKKLSKFMMGKDLEVNDSLDTKYSK